MLFKFMEGVKYYGLDKDLPTGDFTGMTLVKGHDTPLGHLQSFCETLFKYIQRVESYGLENYFATLCTVTLRLQMQHWFNVMKHLLGLGNNSVKYYSNACRE